MKREPNQEQIAALKRFAAANGRYWKSKLNTCWMRAAYPAFDQRRSGDDALLQQVRNTLGPSWLHVFDIEAA